MPNLGEILSAFPEANGAAGADLAERAAAVHAATPTVVLDPYSEIDSTYQVVRHNPLNELAIAVQELNQLMDAYDADMSASSARARGIPKEDLMTIQEVLQPIYEEGQQRISPPTAEDRPIRDVFFEAGVFEIMDEPHLLLAVVDGVRHLWEPQADLEHAERMKEKIGEVAQKLRNSSPENRRRVLVDNLRAREGVLPIVPEEEGIRESMAFKVRATLGAHLKASLQHPSAAAFMQRHHQSLEQIMPSFLVTLMTSTNPNGYGLDDREIDQLARAWCPAELIDDAQAQGFKRLSQAPQVMASLLYRLGILEGRVEKHLLDEVDEVAKVWEILQAQLSEEVHHSDHVSLPILLLRHVVLEHTLLLLRRALAAQANRS